jgi:hypothetical protein
MPLTALSSNPIRPSPPLTKKPDRLKYCVSAAITL